MHLRCFMVCIGSRKPSIPPIHCLATHAILNIPDRSFQWIFISMIRHVLTRTAAQRVLYETNRNGLCICCFLDEVRNFSRVFTHVSLYFGNAYVWHLPLPSHLDFFDDIEIHVITSPCFTVFFMEPLLVITGPTP